MGLSSAKSIKITAVVITRYTTLKELAKSENRFVKIKVIVRTRYLTSPFQIISDQ